MKKENTDLEEEYVLKKVTKYQPIMEDVDDMFLFVLSIPVIGAFIIILYFITRQKETYYEKVKRKDLDS